MAMKLWLDPCGNHAFYRLKQIITLCINDMYSVDELTCGDICMMILRC